MVQRSSIQPEGSFDAQSLGFSQGVMVGPALYVSGQVSSAEGLGPQVEAAWASVLDVVRTAGGEPSDIVKITVYTRDEAAWGHLQPVLMASMDPPYPASTMVTVVGLASPQYMVEIEAIAHLR